MRNKILFFIAVLMIPFVVISFFNKEKETNFILDETPVKEETPEKLAVRVLVSGNVEELELEEYIVGVVAAEMPASFNIEALKAQAVASRSFALYKKNENKSSYDLTDNTNTQVYITLEDMKKKWGTEFNKYYEKVKRAVYETEGEVALYNGEIIEAFYFAMSSGQTQDSEMVFNESLDYLRKAESIYDTEKLSNYAVTKTLSINDFKNKLGIDCTDIKNFKIKRNESDYVDNLAICGKDFKGTIVRVKLGLRSANFEVEISDKVEITTYGYGHGVGMSQYGANGYADAGYTYKDILKHYYNNIEITNLKSV